jgi:DNA processing protein
VGGLIPAPERAARAALTRLAEPGDAWLGRAVAGLGAVEVLDRVRSARAGGHGGL